MVVQHNLTAMNANRMLGLTTSSQAKSTEKLSSGYKINRAADDAAGLSISEKMRKQIRGLSQASLNAQDGISAVQTAEGALTEVHDMLQRMNELAIKAANGTMSEDDRSYVQDEIDQLVTEIDRVSETTKFNETYLLKGTTGTKTVETPETATVSYKPSITGEKTLTWNGAGDNKVWATKDGKSVAVTEQNYKEFLEVTEQTVVSSVTISKDSMVYDADGNALSVSGVKDALNDGTKVYSDKGTAAVAGTDYEEKQDKAVEGDDYVIDADSGDVIFKNCVQFYDADGNALTDETAVKTKLDAGETVYTSPKYQDAIDGHTVYDIDGNVMDAEAITKAVADGTTMYTTSPVVAEEGKDYTVEKETNSVASAKDGYALYGIAPDEATKHGVQLEDQRVSAETLQTYVKIETDLLMDADENVVEADRLGEFFNADGTYKGGLYKYDDNDALKDVGAEQIDDYVVWDRVEASTEEVETEEALTFSLQVGADTTPENKITIDIESMSAKGLGIEGLRVDGADSTNADAAVEVIADAIQKVSTQRSALGAVQNRLEHTINNLDNVVENTTSAESQIRDTDMATEMVKYSNNNILAQAGQAMLAQANQSNQGVLSLLG